MTFPQVASASQDSATGSSVAVSLPSGSAVGDLVVVVFSIDGTPTVTHTGTGWTQDGQANSQASAYVFWKELDGSDSLTINYSATESGGYIALRITGHGSAVEIARAANGTIDGLPDPPPLSPSWGAADTLWIAAFGSDDGAKQLSSYPTSYTANQYLQTTLATASTTTALATRELNASSENPGTFSLGANNDFWVAFTIAVKPAGGGAVSTTLDITAGEVVVDVGATAGSGAVETALSVTTDEVQVSVSGSAPSGGDIRLQFGVRRERGGRWSDATGLEYIVFSADRTSIVQRGTSLSTDPTGIAVIDINGSPFDIGDEVPVLVLEFNGATPEADRTVRTMFGWVQAIAQS